MKTLSISILLILISGISFFTMANSNLCDRYSFPCKKTPLGILLLESNNISGGYSQITLNGVSIYKQKNADMLSYMDFFGDFELIERNEKYFVSKILISYSKKGACIADEGEVFNCNANMIIDLTGEKPIISNEFFSDTGDSYLSWVSWGKLNSVIVFEDDFKFKYSKGHVERVKNEKQ